MIEINIISRLNFGSVENMLYGESNSTKNNSETRR